MTTAANALSNKPGSPFSVFRRRNFTLMWTGQFVETIGYGLTSLASSILVYRLTNGSALSVGLMLIASAAPSLLVGLIAGVIVDRYDRRRIMIAADVLRAVLVCLIPLLVLALYQQYLAERDAFVLRYIKLLSYGGSAEPQAILAEAGLDISTPEFWQGGFDVLQSKLEQLEQIIGGT